MLIETKFSKGDEVYYASTLPKRKTHDCPDCNNTRKWKAISPAGLEYEFGCPRCSQHYSSNHELSLSYTQFEPKVETRTIGSLQINTHEPRTHYMCYETGIGSGQLYNEEDLFTTHDEALKRAKELAQRTNTNLDWVKKQYDATLEICDYQLSDARDHLDKKALCELRWKYQDLCNDISGCATMDQVADVLKEYTNQ